MARAQLLPNLAFSWTRFENDLTSQTRNIFGQPSTTESTYPSKNVALTLRQPLYRPFHYAGYRQAQARAEGVEAGFEKARQDLGARVVAAYLNVLLAEAAQGQVAAEARAIEATLAAAVRALDVGQGTRTERDDLQARLDMNRAQQLKVRQQIDQARHELAILINRPADTLRLPAQWGDAPGDLETGELARWIEKAQEVNPELRELQARVEAARHEVARARAGHKPTLDLIAQRILQESDNVANPNSRYDNTQVGLQLNLPLFAGGYVDAQVRQALAFLAESEQRLESARRRLATQVRREFQSVQEGMLRIQALDQAERSARELVRSSEKSHLAGIRSRLDILDAEQKSASARFELARERLGFVMAHARLLGLTGGLDHDAVERMNRWLMR